MSKYRRNSYIDCWDETDIICPYCYEEVEDYDYSVARSEDMTEVYCPNCGKTFYCVAEHKITYTSTRMGENGEEISEWEDEDVEISDDRLSKIFNNYGIELGDKDDDDK